MRLDVNTLTLITTLLCLLLALVLFMLRRSYPPSIKGLGEWVAAILVSFGSSLLFITRGHAPDFVSKTLAQGALFLALYIFYRGCQKFLGVPVTWVRWLLGTGAALLVLNYYVVSQPDPIQFGLWTSLSMAVCFLALVRLLWTHGPALFSTRFALTVLGSDVVVCVITTTCSYFRYDPMGAPDLINVRALFVAALSLTVMGFSVGLILMATERLRTELENLAAHDSLTGALTRRVMTDACEIELERFRRSKRDVSVLMLDLDFFKKINDNHGHFVGDQVLVDFVTRVKALLRTVDRLGRFGGEEFIILLPETGLDGAHLVAERIRLAAAQADTPGLPSYTVSIGLTVSNAQDASMDIMLKRADAALYRAKTQGRNRVEVG